MLPVKRQPRSFVSKVTHHHHYHVPVQHTHTHRHVHKDSYQPAASVASPRPRMVSVGTQTDGPAMPQMGPEGFMGYARRQAKKLLPAIQFVSNVIIFVAGRVNFGFGFKVPWLPYVGLGAP